MYTNLINALTQIANDAAKFPEDDLVAQRDLLEMAARQIDKNMKTMVTKVGGNPAFYGGLRFQFSFVGFSV